MLSDLVPASGGTGGLAPSVGAGEGRGLGGRETPASEEEGVPSPKINGGPGGTPGIVGHGGTTPSDVRAEWLSVRGISFWAIRGGIREKCKFGSF